MTKQTMLLYACILGIPILLLSSCVKTPPNFDPRDGNNVYSGCRIRQIINPTTHFTPGSNRQFTYNSHNDPVGVATGGPGTGSPDLVFKYDNKNRLIEYSGIYSNGLYEFVHRYGYSHDRIVTDTQYVFGHYGNLTDYQSKRYKYLWYDNLNRIVKDSEQFVYPSIFTNVISYQYDANGNLADRATYGYDSKLNPHRTNKVWMFIDRDYSVNNLITANTYNSSGLPLTFAPNQKLELDMIFAYFYYYDTTQVIYDCQ